MRQRGGFVTEMNVRRLFSCTLLFIKLIFPFKTSCRAAIKKPVGILQVKVVRGLKLLRMDILGTSDPYVKLSLTEDRLPAKKTSIKMKSLNPEWNEKFKLIVKDPYTQGLELQVYDWDKVFPHLCLFFFSSSFGAK